jgi:MFS family permease
MRERARRGALYAGGFLGPFGGGVLVVLIPDLRAQFDVSTAVASAVIPAYIVPFAAVQLVSGTLGERFGVARTIRAAYVAYAAVSLLAAAATAFEVLLLARALQGVANAFTTPLLLAALAADTPEQRLGRTMGAFAAVQTAGIVSAPLVGGLAGHVDLRLAFLGPALAALVLALVPLPVAAARAAADPEPPSLRSAVNRRVAWLAVAAFLTSLAVTGLGFLVALHAADEFGLDATSRGLLLAGFGVAGVVAGPIAGRLVERAGQSRIAILGALASALTVPLLGIAGTTLGLATAWVAAGLGSALLWTGLNTLGVEAAPANRAGAVSFIGAWKFAGNAAAPAVWLPLYSIRASAAFAAAGLVCVGIAGVIRRVGEPGRTGGVRPAETAG